MSKSKSKPEADTVTVTMPDGTSQVRDAKEYLNELNPPEKITSVLQLVNPVLAEQKQAKKEIVIKDPTAKLTFKQSRAIVAMIYSLTHQRLDWNKIAHFTKAQASEEIRKLKAILDGGKA